MTEHTSSLRKSLGKSLAWLLALVLVPLALAACETSDRPADYRAAHPLYVSKETVSMSVRVPVAQQGLTGEAALEFDGFVRDYLNRGRRALTIKTGGEGNLSGAEQVRSLLVNSGIQAREISITEAGFSSADVIVSFAAHKVRVPECGDWSSESNFNPSGRVHSNYGCATQRNLGLMVQDPGDLLKAKTMSPGDGEHAAGVIRNYRTAPVASGAGGASEEVSIGEQ